MIPKLDPDTGYLPAGVHDTAWEDIPAHFSGNSHRQTLIKGLHAALRSLAAAGCRTVLLDGSFVSIKLLPNDYDAAWETVGVNPLLLDPVFLDFSNKRAAMKAKYGGEFFPASAMAAGGVVYRDFFQRDRNGIAKGVLQIDLGRLP